MFSQTNKTELKINYLNYMRKNGVYLKDDFIELINDRWFQFHPATSIDHTIFALINIGIMLFGLPGNILVIYVFCK